MKSSTLRHQANSISQMVMQNMHTERNEYLNAMQETKEQIFKALASSGDAVAPPLAEAQPQLATQPAANATVAPDPVMVEVLKLLQKLDNDSNKRKRSDRTSTKNNDSTPRERFGEVKNGKYMRFDKSKYCHSHGACNHDGKDCRNKRHGHKEAATFDNKMGGSKRFCQPCT